MGKPPRRSPAGDIHAALICGDGGNATASNTQGNGGEVDGNNRARGGKGSGKGGEGGDATNTAGNGAKGGSAKNGSATNGSASNGSNIAGNGGAGGAGGTGGVGNGGLGGTGGEGGDIRVSAGTFNMSNTMAAVGQSAAGIMVATQNSGVASLIQNSVVVQANLKVGQ